MTSQQPADSLLTADPPPSGGSRARSAAPGVRAPDRSAVLNAAYDEYCRRRDGGEALDPDEFCARFPNFRTSLHGLLRAHQFFQENPELVAQLGPAQWPEVGGTFLGFALRHELGRGTFARVFLAAETALGDRPVAVKVSQHGGVEAETLGRLRHPNIVPVHSVQEDPVTSLTAVCMPYLGSATLCDVLDYADASPAGRHWAAGILRVVLNAGPAEEAPEASGRAPAVLRYGTFVDGVLHLAVQLADALAFVHGRGFCHGDLKPSNVLLSPDGRPMLLDFNLSV